MSSTTFDVGMTVKRRKYAERVTIEARLPDGRFVLVHDGVRGPRRTKVSTQTLAREYEVLR